MALGLAQDLPKQIGSINDYGQTLVRADRQRLEGLIASLKERGCSLVYLASWHDPFQNPGVYAREVFKAWRLPGEAVLLVFVRGEDRRWRVGAALGEKAQATIPAGGWKDLLAQAEVEVNRGQPALAALNLAQRLLHLLTTGRTATSFKGWAYALAGAAGAAVVLLLGRAFLCPRCFRPLRRRPSFRGIIAVCPRCRWTRAAARWGRGAGSRGGY